MTDNFKEFYELHAIASTLKHDAARAYDKTAINYHGAFAKTNKTMGIL